MYWCEIFQAFVLKKNIMRLTNILLKQHNGWLQKIKWKIQGKRNILDTGVITKLQKRGIVVSDATKYLNTKKVS